MKLLRPYKSKPKPPSAQRKKKMDETKTEKATKREKVLVDVKVEADLSGMLRYSHFLHHYKDEEERAKELDRATKDFNDFLHDHRSQDMISLDVQRIYKDLCSVCGEEWEPDRGEDGKLYCANCGAEIEE